MATCELVHKHILSDASAAVLGRQRERLPFYDTSYARQLSTRRAGTARVIKVGRWNGKEKSLSRWGPESFCGTGLFLPSTASCEEIISETVHEVYSDMLQARRSRPLITNPFAGYPERSLCMCSKKKTSFLTYSGVGIRLSAQILLNLS